MLHNIIRKALVLASIFLLLQAGIVGAEEFRGKVVKVKGDVHVIDAQGKRTRVDDSKFLVRELDTIVTDKGGNVIVQFNDGAMTVLDEKSSLQVEKTNWLSHLGGKIYFTFRKIFGQPRKVKTAFATLGVRGTTFIVYNDENGKGVALAEGQLEVESPGPDFEIHRKQQMDEFEAFKQQAHEQQQALKKEFDDYRNRMQKEFVEYKKNFTLEADHVIRFDGTRVDETTMDDNTKADFAAFEKEAGDMLIEFRKQASEYKEKMEQEQQQDAPKDN
jgi:ferric-dicitrate binding protein FerR (iron transport regulator)